MNLINHQKPSLKAHEPTITNYCINADAKEKEATKKTSIPSLKYETLDPPTYTDNRKEGILENHSKSDDEHHDRLML